LCGNTYALWIKESIPKIDADAAKAPSLYFSANTLLDREVASKSDGELTEKR